MKVIIVCISLLVIAFRADAQAVVSAPVLENIAATTGFAVERQSGFLATMTGVVQALEKAEHEFREAMKKATWLRDLQSARRLLYMIENLVCTSKDISVNIGYADAHSSCIVQYKFDISVAKIQMSADYLGILLTDGISMSPAERMQVMAITQAKYEEANDEFVKIQRELNAKKVESQINAAIYRDLEKLIRIQKH
jgi:hypothetical protein